MRISAIEVNKEHRNEGIAKCSKTIANLYS